MPECPVPSVLAVACSAPSDDGLLGADNPLSLGHAESGYRALELMQLLRYDLVVVGAGLSDMSLWTMVQRMRVLAPWQKWMLVGSGAQGPGISSEAEIAARALGAIAVIDDPGDWSDIGQMAQAVAKKSRRSLVMAS